MVSKMLRRVSIPGAQGYQNKEGTFKVMGIYGRIIPIVSLVLMERAFEENFGKKRVDDLFYLIGETQSYNATAWTVKKVGIPLKGCEKKIFTETIGHSEVTGLGVPKVMRFDIEKKFIVVTMENNIFARQYMNFFGLQKSGVDHYVRGLFGGTAKFLFGEDVVVYCEQCISMGKSNTIYKIFPRKNCIEKYGDKVKEYIPDTSLKTAALDGLDLRKLVG